MSAGRLVIISGPSGAGKTSIVKRLLEKSPLPIRMSVSATTRPARPGEQDGVDYHFLTDEQFQQKRSNNEFLECFEVFGRGYWYGTLRENVESDLSRGDWVLLEIDVNGMQQVQQQFPDVIPVFVRPDSLDELERRLRDRKTENEETIQRRLEVAKAEWKSKDDYMFDVVNDQLEPTVDRICQLLMETCSTN